MLKTLELRWFSHGQPPAEVEHWFNADCPGELLETPEDREDLYLYTPECEYLNIKLRQGSLEVKWRKVQLGSLRFSDLWQGKIEKWLKWSCEDSEQQNLMPADMVGKRPWISVEKVRIQRLYQGVACELTQLRVKNDAWWSIAFEMAGEDTNQLDNFEAVITQVSQTYRGPELLAETSFAYPTWLSLVT